MTTNKEKIILNSRNKKLLELKYLFEVEFKNNSSYIRGEFEDSEWIVQDLKTKYRHRFSFRINEEISNFSSEVIISLKEITLNKFIEGYSVHHLSKFTKNICLTLEITNFFHEDNLMKFETELVEKNKCKINTLKTKFSHLAEFIDFSSMDIPEEYEIIIISYLVRQSSSNHRLLPKNKDILTFSLIVEDYFKENTFSKQKIRYFPIFFWWKFTTIIPIRINEFCNIPKNALDCNDGCFKLTIPRGKQELQREYRYEDVNIPTELGVIIEKYTEITQSKNEGETLLVGKLYSDLKISNEFKMLVKSFSSNKFFTLLRKFYKEVVGEIYGFNIMEFDNNDIIVGDKYIERILRPNDTRHLAFLNLMLQGLHPSEIAKLGGHTSLSAQYSYQRHLEYWIDSDLVNLLVIQQGELQELSRQFFFNQEVKQKITDIEIQNLIPLKIGYCKDPQMSCPTDTHFDCPYWYITEKDYLENIDFINSLINEKQIDINMMITKLLQMHDSSLLTAIDMPKGANDSKFNYEINQQALVIKDALFRLSELKGAVKKYEQTRS